ncbi:MAG: hypothetical protein LBF34_04285 [Puniceicoccales bacterium]|jgi:hypothetical protein|nr:hypothetical protein [Puniceicoccales bacterium]
MKKTNKNLYMIILCGVMMGHCAATGGNHGQNALKAPQWRTGASRQSKSFGTVLKGRVIKPRQSTATTRWSAAAVDKSFGPVLKRRVIKPRWRTGAQRRTGASRQPTVAQRRTGASRQPTVAQRLTGAPEWLTATTYNRTRSNPPNQTQTSQSQTSQSFADQPPQQQQTSKKRYSSNGAYLPIIWQCPSSSIFETMYPRRSKLSDAEKATLNDIQQLFNYLQKNVPQSDEKALEVLELTKGELYQVRWEGFGGKGRYASVRAMDGIVSVATHLLTQQPTKQEKDELKKLLIQTLLMMRSMSHNSSTEPYWEIIKKNMTIASKILEIDLSFE